MSANEVDIKKLDADLSNDRYSYQDDDGDIFLEMAIWKPSWWWLSQSLSIFQAHGVPANQDYSM